MKFTKKELKTLNNALLEYYSGANYFKEEYDRIKELMSRIELELVLD